MNAKKKQLIHRTFWITMTGIGLGSLFWMLVPEHLYNPPKYFRLIQFFYSIVVLNFLFNGLVIMNRKLDSLLPWYYYPTKRLVVEGSFTLIANLSVFIMNYTFFRSIMPKPLAPVPWAKAVFAFIITSILLFVGMAVIIARNFFQNWKKSLLEVEKLKQEKVKSDYKALQNQLNPHFLFNNLNMLVSEIRRDQEKAVRITEELSDVYRYVLQSKDHETVPLEDELEFAESFMYLQKVRFGDNLVLTKNIAPEAMSLHLPPLTLQVLLENAIKHNVVSSVKPLHIEMYDDEDYLEVKNNFQPRKSTYSTHTGLKNIKLRYSIISQRNMEIFLEDDVFRVKVPLLNPYGDD